jgi:hypothetical protein
METILIHFERFGGMRDLNTRVLAKALVCTVAVIDALPEI